MNPYFYIPFLIGLGAAILAGWAIWRVYKARTRALSVLIQKKDKMNQSLGIRYNNSLDQYKSLKKNYQRQLIREKDMSDVIKDWEQKYEILNADFNKLRQNWSNLKTEFEGYRWDTEAQIAKLKNEAGDDEAKLKTLKGMYNDLNASYSTLQHEYKEFKRKANEEIKQLEESCNKLRNEIKEVQKDCEMKVGESFVQFAELNSEYKRIEKEKENLLDQYEKALEKLNEIPKEVEILKLLPVEVSGIIPGEEMPLPANRAGSKKALESLKNNAFASNDHNAVVSEYTKADKDDLQRIEGIGPKIEQLLNNSGISRFEKLGKMEIKDLLDILNAGGKRFQMHDPATWPQQSRLAAKGDWAGLNKLQKELKGGRKVK